MFSSFKAKEFNVRVKLDTNRMVELDVLKELRIDPTNIREELTLQPAKYALWATIHDVHEIKLEQVKKEVLDSLGSTRYRDVLKQYDAVQQQQHLLTTIKNAFNHRKLALLSLWDNPKNKEALAVYESYIKALEDTVPYSQITQEVV